MKLLRILFLNKINSFSFVTTVSKKVFTLILYLIHNFRKMEKILVNIYQQLDSFFRDRFY